MAERMEDRQEKPFIPRVVPARDLPEFSYNIQTLLKSLECSGGGEIDPYDCKRHLRFNAATYDESNIAKPFASGAYMAYYDLIYGENEAEQEKVARLVPILDEVSQAVNSDMSEDGLFTFIVAKWNQLADIFASSREDTGTYYILWRIFEPVVLGEIQTDSLNDGKRRLSYIKLSDDGSNRAVSQKTYNVYLKFCEQCNLSIRPSFRHLLETDESLDSQFREIFLANCNGEGIVNTLMRDAEIIAFADNDNIEEYFDTIGNFLDYLIKNYTEKQNGLPEDHPGRNGTRSAIAYLNCIKKRYLPELKRYCATMREYKKSQPYMAALLAEAYIIKHNMVSESDEPDVCSLFEKWIELQKDHESRAPASAAEGSFHFKTRPKRHETPVVVVQTAASIQNAMQERSARAASGPFSRVPRPASSDVLRTIGYLPTIDDGSPSNSGEPKEEEPAKGNAIFDTPVSVSVRTSGRADTIYGMKTFSSSQLPPRRPNTSVSAQTPETARAETSMRMPALQLPPEPPQAVIDSERLPHPASLIEKMAHTRTPDEGPGPQADIGTSSTLMDTKALSTTIEHRIPVTENTVRALFSHQFDSQQSRRHALNELHRFLLETESEEEKRNLVSAFVETLLENSKRSPAAKLTSDMCKVMGIKKPKRRDIKPEAFLAPYGEDLNEASLNNEDVSESLLRLLEKAKRLSLIGIYKGASSDVVDVHKIDDGYFQMICRNLFISLQYIRNKIYGQLADPGTWGRRSKYKEERKFYKKLRKTITAQLAIIEHLIFTESSV